VLKFTYLKGGWMKMKDPVEPANALTTTYRIATFGNLGTKPRAISVSSTTPPAKEGAEIMANLQSETVILGSDAFTSLASPAHKVGTRGVDKQGRVYRYVLAGAADLVAGNVVQGPRSVPNHLANTPPAVAIGATSFSYTPGNTAGGRGVLRERLLQVDTTPGNGYMYGVDSHPAISSPTAFTLNLKSDDAVQVALTTASRVGLMPNPVPRRHPVPVTTATGSVVGVAVYPITAAQYGWIQTWGPARCSSTARPRSARWSWRRVRPRRDRST
jgi:hypothetical protein